jgi:hypothetical protein
MKRRTIITFAILSLFAMVAPSANADTNSSTTTTKKLASTTGVNTSETVESAPITEVSDAPVYIESLKTDNIIEKDRHHRLISGLKHGQ